MGRLRNRLEDNSLSASSLTNLQKRLKIYDSAIASETHAAVQGASKRLVSDFEQYVASADQVDDRVVADRLIELDSAKAAYLEDLIDSEMAKIKETIEKSTANNTKTKPDKDLEQDWSANEIASLLHTIHSFGAGDWKSL